MSTENLVLYYATIKGIPSEPRPSGPTEKERAAAEAKRRGDRTLKHSSEAKVVQKIDLSGHQYWDTHTHIDQILARHKLPLSAYSSFKAANFPAEFAGCVSVCCEIEAIEPTIELIDAHQDIVAAFGIHPHNASTYTEEVEKRLVSLMEHPKTVAWGEIGLDYHYNLSDQEVQRNMFGRQIDMAVRANKPIVIHSREAEADTIQIMRKHLPKDWRVHVHCFTSSAAMATEMLSEWPNLCIGFTGVITFAGALQKVVKAVPIERILLETDGPYMAPIPFRGEVCHSGHIPYTAQKISEIKRIPLSDVLEHALANSRRVYGLQ